MKQASERKFDRNEVLKKCFDCLVSNGLENTSIRSFSTASGLNSSSLYYWFHNKDEIVLAATLHGLKTIIDDLFTQAYGYLNDLDTLFAHFPRVIATYTDHLICTADPRYFKAGQSRSTSAASALSWACKWIILCEMWLNGEIGDDLAIEGNY